MQEDVNPFLDLDALHAAIESEITAQYPDLKVVEFYREEERKQLPLPAILLDLTEFEVETDKDPGTGQLAVNARFEAEIIFGFNTPNVKREIRKFAAAFAAWLRLRRWKGIVGPDAVQVIGCYRDAFHPQLDKYEVWRVEFAQVLYIGEKDWTNEGKIPSTVYIGYSPAVGTGSEPAYTELT
jgi:hypothetical protein